MIPQVIPLNPIEEPKDEFIESVQQASGTYVAYNTKICHNLREAELAAHDLIHLLESEDRNF